MLSGLGNFVVDCHSSVFANVAKKQSNVGISVMLLHLTRVDDVMCFKHISFLFLVQKKRLEVNEGEK